MSIALSHLGPATNARLACPLQPLCQPHSLDPQGREEVEGSRVGGTEGRRHAGRVSSYSELPLNCLGMGVAFPVCCPGPLASLLGPRRGLGEWGGVWACACWGWLDSKCSSELIAFPGL